MSREFSVRNIIKQNVYKQMYGNLMNRYYINDNLFMPKNKFITGGSSQYSMSNNSNNDNSSNQNDELNGASKEMNFKIQDTFVKYKTNNMLFGKVITPYAKKVIFEVIKYYNSKDIEGNTDLKRRIIKYLNKVFEDKQLNYDKLMQKFGAQTNECLLGYMLIAYQRQNLDLMLRTMYTFGRVLPLDYKTEWFDNYRLNAYGNVLNMVMWKKYDMNDVYTIDESPKPINKSVKIDFVKAIKYLVGSLRAFIIDKELYPNSSNMSGGGNSGNPSVNEQMSSSINSSSMQNVAFSGVSGGDIEKILDPRDYHEFKNDGAKNECKNKSAEQICDECYEHYPFYFGGSHGCDVFSLGMTLTIPEIKTFLERYPSARVGYILNTSTYRSGKGEHWVAMEFTKGKAKLICSQQSDFSVFHDDGQLRSAIRSACMGEEWNNRVIQVDNENCGLYSVLSLLELLRFGNIDKAVDAIGVNMKNLGKDVGKPSNAELVREKLAGVK